MGHWSVPAGFWQSTPLHGVSGILGGWNRANWNRKGVKNEEESTRFAVVAEDVTTKYSLMLASPFAIIE